MELPAPAARTTDVFLDAIDFMAPDLVEGLYLRGSLAWGEFFPGSDVDFTALLTRTPDANDLAALAAAHARVIELVPGTPFEGFHATDAQLQTPPAELQGLPVARCGELTTLGDLDVNPVSWHELATHGITVAGPKPASLGIWTDARELREFTAANLRTYWMGWYARLTEQASAGIGADEASWCVLGVSRLLHLLVTGELTAKSAAGRWAAAEMGPKQLPVIAEALRARETPEQSSTFPDVIALGAAVRAYLRAVLTQAATL